MDGEPDVPAAGVYETGLYRVRFDEAEVARIRALWRPICAYLQRYVDAQGTTLDIGAGACHFINQIRSARRIAVDINAPNLQRYAAPDVECLTSSAVAFPAIVDASVDAVFASNVYEHFFTREDVATSVGEAFRVLRPGGRFIVMQPNFRYAMKRYYDFFDHRLAFTHEAIVEVLQTAGFEIERATAQFLPYTTKSSLPQSAALVALYLRVPLAWRLLGGQLLVVGRKV